LIPANRCKHTSSGPAQPDEVATPELAVDGKLAAYSHSMVPGGFEGDVVDDLVYAAHLVDDAGSGMAEKLVRNFDCAHRP
jgi:hypothetical protein